MGGARRPRCPVGASSVSAADPPAGDVQGSGGKVCRQGDSAAEWQRLRVALQAMEGAVLAMRVRCLGEYVALSAGTASEGLLAVLGGGYVCGGPFQFEAGVCGPVGDTFGDAQVGLVTVSAGAGSCEKGADLAVQRVHAAAAAGDC